MASVEAVSRYRWAALAIALIAVWCVSLVSQLLAPLAPIFQPELGLTKAEVGVFTVAASAGAWTTALASGLLTDRHGIRWIVSVSLFVTGILLLFMSGISAAGQAIALMFAAGVTRGCANPGGTKIIIDWFPHKTRATAMGVKQIGMPLAGLLAATLLPSLALDVGWRGAVVAVGVVIIVGAVVIGVFYREAPRSGRLPRGKAGMRVALRELVRDPGLWILCGSGAFFYMVQFSLFNYTALYFKDVVLVESIPDVPTRIVAAGGYLAILQVGGIIGRVAWGVVSDRIFHGRRGVVMVIVGGLSALLSVAMGQLNAASPAWLLAAIAFLYGSTGFGWNGVYNAMIGETIGRKYAGTAIGMSMTLTEAGVVAGPPLFGFVADVSGSYQAAWFFLGFASVVGAVGAVIAAMRESRYAMEQVPASRPA